MVTHLLILYNDIDGDDGSICPKIINHFPYHDNRKVLSTLHTCKTKLTIFSTNIQSINSKIDELRLFVKRLNTVNFMFIPICNQESWLSECDDLSLIQLDGYKYIPQGKICSSSFIYMKVLNISSNKNLTNIPPGKDRLLKLWKGKH